MGEAKRRNSQGAPRRRSRRNWALPVGLALVALAVAGLVLWLSNPRLAVDLPQAAEGAPDFAAELDRYGVSLGDPEAPVVVREFADYQCPACASFADQFGRFKAEYIDTGKARLVFFDFPLGGHRNAVPAAMAARCAGDQNAYWSMHQRLFEQQSRWAASQAPETLFGDYAERMGLDRELFQRCLSSGRHRDAVERSRQVGVQMRVASTPTVYVDKVLLSRPGWYQLAGVVERELKE